MPGIDSFPDVIKAVNDIWGLLALAVLVLGILALQMTKDAQPNVRVATFLVILAVFVLCLYMALSNDRPQDESTSGGPAAGPALGPEEIAARKETAGEYSESLDNAYGAAADRMNDLAGQISGESDTDGEGPADAD